LIRRLHAFAVGACAVAFVQCTSMPERPLARTWDFPIREPAEVVQRNGAMLYRGQSETIVEFADGAVSAWSNPDAPQMQRGWPASMAAHDALAREYFLKHGIPEAEIGSTLHYSGYSSGAAMAQPQSVQTSRLGYATTFTRRVAGFTVLDSHAGVQLNTDRQPVALAKSWPTVPQETLERARAMRSVLEQGWKPPADVVLGRRVVSTEVVLRHRVFQRDLKWNAVIRMEMLSGPTMHTWVDVDEEGRRIETVDTLGASPQSYKQEPPPSIPPR
jgi:hypothetical protein